MKRIKIFGDSFNIQGKIDEWIDKVHPDIISVTSSLASSAHGTTYSLITVLYEDNTSVKL